jgi:WD40 repeat protein
MSGDRETPSRRAQTRLEIVHESLLLKWPRLVRWQAQDSESAVLRDQLRQAAQVWEQRGRAEDYLWSGTAFREYQLWRERYPGGLTSAEEAFATAMTRRAHRERRRKQLAVGVGFAVLVVVLATVGGLWRRSEGARHRAEANALLALAQSEIERFPTAALAYATKSLEIADTREGRRFVLRALAKGPPVKFLPSDSGRTAMRLAFSPASDLLAVCSMGICELHSRDNAPSVVLDHEQRSWVSMAFDRPGERVASVAADEIRVWSVATGKELWRRRIDDAEQGGLIVRGDRIFSEMLAEDGIELRLWSFADKDSTLVGTFDTEWGSDIDAAGRRLAYTRGRQVWLRSLEDWNSPPRLLGEHSTLVRGVSFHPGGESVAASDAGGEIRIWRANADGPSLPMRMLPSEGRELLLHDPSGHWLAAYSIDRGLGLRLWDLDGPPDAAPLRLEQSAIDTATGSFDLAFAPNGKWLASAHSAHVAFWPLERETGWVLGGRRARVNDLAFTADSRALLSADEEGFLRLWPLAADGGERGRVLVKNASGLTRVIGKVPGLAVAAGYSGEMFSVPLDHRPPTKLRAFTELTNIGALAVSPGGGRVAAGPTSGSGVEGVIRVWDLATGSELNLGGEGTVPGAGGAGPLGFVQDLLFLDEARILSSHADGLRLWDLRRHSHQVISHEGFGRLAAAGDSPEFFATRLAGPLRTSGERPAGELVRVGVDGAIAARLASHGPQVSTVGLDPTGKYLITGSSDGLVRAGLASGEEPRIVADHGSPVLAVAISSDGRWIASSGTDLEIRVWRMPDLSQTPFHALPRQSLLDRLLELTNLRAVEDPSSATGWQIRLDPFPGWDGEAKR